MGAAAGRLGGSVILALLGACARGTAELPPLPPPATPPPLVSRVTVAAVGDALMLRRVRNTAAALAADGVGNEGYDGIWSAVAEPIRAADLAFANLEVPLAEAHLRGYAYQVLNAPPAVAPSLRDLGVDVVSFANNHGFDQGPLGLVETLEGLESAGLRYAGAGRTCADARAPARFSINGVEIAIVAMTDLMNIDERAGEDAPCVFVAGPRCERDCTPDRDAIFYTADRARIQQAISAAREGADAVIVSFHWGDEYRTEPLPLYRQLAPALIDMGADVVLGHHPHVLQPIERHAAPDGREGVIFYSLGNFVSDMGRAYTVRHPARRGDVRDGLLARFSLVKTRHPDGRVDVAVEGVRGVPLWTDNNAVGQPPGEPDRVRVVPLASVSDPVLREARWARISSIVDPALLEWPHD